MITQTFLSPHAEVSTTHCKFLSNSVRFRSKLDITIINWYFVSKIVLTNNCSSDREKLLKFETEGREFAKILRLLERFIQAVKVSTFFETEYSFNLFLEVSQIYNIRTIQDKNIVT